jgi:hypothetical protein
MKFTYPWPITDALRSVAQVRSREFDNIDVIAGFPAGRQGEGLVGGDVEPMESPAQDWIALDGEETERRVGSPVNLQRLGPAGDLGAAKSGFFLPIAM